MDDYSPAEHAFENALERARHLCEIQSYLATQYTPALDTSDMLRAAVVLIVSAFDFLIHEIFRIEVIGRYKKGIAVGKLNVPFGVLIANSGVENLIEDYVRKYNAHRSFVDPGKYAEAMSFFVAHPWSRISAQTGKAEDAMKRRLRAIYGWRNRIAHEADIKPVLAGVELWPIAAQDVLDALKDIETLGIASINVLRCQSP